MALNFRSSSVSAPQTGDVSPPPSFHARLSPPLRQSSLDSFRARVKPLVIARPATADETPGERHPLEIWEINYDEIFPNSARLAKQFAENSLSLTSSSPMPAASPAGRSAATPASATPSAPQQSIVVSRQTQCISSPVADDSSPISDIASPLSPPTITIPARAISDTPAPVGLPQLRARLLGCKLGTPCIALLARTPGDPGAWDADDEEYESEESTRRRFRRSCSTSGSRQVHGKAAGGGSYKERVRGPSPLSGRVGGAGAEAGAQQHGSERVLRKRCSDPVMRSPRADHAVAPHHAHRLAQVRCAEPEARHRLARSSSPCADPSARSSSAGRRRRSAGRFCESASVGSEKVRTTVRFYSDLLDPCVIASLAAAPSVAAGGAARRGPSPVRSSQSGGEGEMKFRTRGNGGKSTGSGGRTGGGTMNSPHCGGGSHARVARGGLAAAATAAAAATGPCRVVSLC